MIRKVTTLRNTVSTTLHSFTVHAAAACLLAFGGTVSATALLDGSFENQAVLQSLPGYTDGPNPPGGLQGASWPGGLPSTWQVIAPVAGSAWMGGSIARTEEYAAGWKWAQEGSVFGIIQASQMMTQTFKATETGLTTLSWFDANRPSWKTDTWFGRQNDYNVTLTEVGLGTAVQIFSGRSEVYLGLESNSLTNASDARFSPEGKKGWFARSSDAFMLESGKSYTLSFNSQPGSQNVDDRSTFLDNISLRSQAVPLPGTLAILIAGAGGLLLGTGRRRRVQASSGR
jgi:hypothetical protein